MWVDELANWNVRRSCKSGIVPRIIHLSIVRVPVILMALPAETCNNSYLQFHASKPECHWLRAIHDLTMGNQGVCCRYRSPNRIFTPSAMVGFLSSADVVHRMLARSNNYVSVVQQPSTSRLPKLRGAIDVSLKENYFRCWLRVHSRNHCIFVLLIFIL